jgi:hypothetical protein
MIRYDIRIMIENQYGFSLTQGSVSPQHLVPKDWIT